MCHGWWMRTENCENLCMKQFASSILAFSRITIQTQYSKYKRKKREKKNENKTRNTQSKRTNNEIIDLITKHQWEKKMRNGKKCGRAEKWHERRKKIWSKRKKNSHVSAATQSYEGGTSDLSTPWMSLLIMLKYTLACRLCVYGAFLYAMNIFFFQSKEFSLLLVFLPFFRSVYRISHIIVQSQLKTEPERHLHWTE